MFISLKVLIREGFIQNKQAEKLKSRELKEGWMKNDEGRWRMKDDDFKLLTGFADRM